MRLLNERQVEYLLIGGYAVVYYGYPRTTGDLDIWIAQDTDNAEKIAVALQDFGFDIEEVYPGLFLQPNSIHRIGIPPLRIEILTTISGVDFADCWAVRQVTLIDDIPVAFIDLSNLKANKKASGRLKDLNDLKHLP